MKTGALKLGIIFIIFKLVDEVVTKEVVGTLRRPNEKTRERHELETRFIMKNIVDGISDPLRESLLHSIVKDIYYECDQTNQKTSTLYFSFYPNVTELTWIPSKNLSRVISPTPSRVNLMLLRSLTSLNIITLWA